MTSIKKLDGLYTLLKMRMTTNLFIDIHSEYPIILWYHEKGPKTMV
jgi:hypothetical protein